MARVYVTLEVLEADDPEHIIIAVETSAGLPDRTIAALLRGALEKYEEPGNSPTEPFA